jgi:hypothetical protein
VSTRTERDKERAIKARVIKARGEWRLHRKICRLCAQLSANRSQYCDDGWAIRVELHHAERASHDYRNATPARQDTLF